MFNQPPMENGEESALDLIDKANGDLTANGLVKSGKERALDYINKANGDSTEEDLDKYRKRSCSGREGGIKYQYSNIDTSTVRENISEFIIPECQKACQKIWALNIDTFMCSNYQDQNLYILISGLSEENLEIFYKKMACDNRYYLDEYRDSYGIGVQGMSPESVEELNSLVDVFVMQDVSREKYKNSEDFLFLQKCQGGCGEVLNDGTIVRGINPKLENLTFEEALEKEGVSSLYVKDEDRVYESQYYLDAHKRYLEFIKNNDKESGELSKD